jgi:hypothetical protein
MDVEVGEVERDKEEFDSEEEEYPGKSNIN